LTQGFKINNLSAQRQPQEHAHDHRPQRRRSHRRHPLIRLNRASAATGCEIWAKAEFMNPGQSVKDRAALYIIRDAEKTRPA